MVGTTADADRVGITANLYVSRCAEALQDDLDADLSND